MVVSQETTTSAKRSLCVAEHRARRCSAGDQKIIVEGRTTLVVAVVAFRGLIASIDQHNRHNLDTTDLQYASQHGDLQYASQHGVDHSDFSRRKNRK